MFYIYSIRQHTVVITVTAIVIDTVDSHAFHESISETFADQITAQVYEDQLNQNIKVHIFYKTSAGIDPFLREIHLIAAEKFFCSEVGVIAIIIIKSHSGKCQRISGPSSLKFASRDAGPESHLRKIHHAISFKINKVSLLPGKRFYAHSILYVGNIGQEIVIFTCSKDDHELCILFQMVERSSRIKIRDSERITVDLEQPLIDMPQHKKETLMYKINRAALSLSVSSHDTAH